MSNLIPPFTTATDRGYKFLRVFDQYNVARGGRIVLYVEGGISPYTWAVSGTDFTLDEEETDVQYNFLEAAADIDIDVTETVTITDANSEEVTIDVCSCNISSEACTTDLESASVSPNVDSLECISVTITAMGGCPPYYWEVSEDVGDVELGALWTNAPVNTIRCIDADCYTSGCSGFSVTITDDNDDEVTTGVGCYDGLVYELDGDLTDDTIDDSTPATVTISGGLPPYNWTIGGTGFTIEPEGSSTSTSAVVTASGGCGVATVTITDACETTLTKQIRHTSGAWGGTVQVYAYCGEAPGYCWSYACPGTYSTCEANHPDDFEAGAYKFKDWTSMCSCTAAGVWFTTGDVPPDPKYIPSGYPSPEMGYGQMDCGSEAERCILTGYYVDTWACP